MRNEYDYEVNIRRSTWDTGIRVCNCDSEIGAAEVVRIILQQRDSDIVELLIRVVPKND